MSPVSSSCNSHSRISVRFLNYASHQFSPVCKVINYAFSLQDQSFGNFSGIPVSPASMSSDTHCAYLQCFVFTSFPDKMCDLAIPNGFPCHPRGALVTLVSHIGEGFLFTRFPFKKRNFAIAQEFLCRPSRAAVKPILAYLNDFARRRPPPAWTQI